MPSNQSADAEASVRLLTKHGGRHALRSVEDPADPDRALSDAIGPEVATPLSIIARQRRDAAAAVSERVE